MWVGVALQGKSFTNTFILIMLQYNYLLTCLKDNTGIVTTL